MHLCLWSPHHCLVSLQVGRGFSLVKPGFLQAALLIRKAIRGYKHCNGILQRQQRASRSEHDVGAVKLGFGGFSLAISLLPPRLLRLLSVLGFPCDRVAGLSSIDESLRGGGLRAPVAGVYIPELLLGTTMTHI